MYSEKNTIGVKNIIEKINLKEKFSYFKKMIWIFLLVLIICNIILFYVLNGVYYFLALVIGNVILVWILIPIFMWIGKTYLIDTGLEIVEDLKEDMVNSSNEKIVKIIKK